MHVYIYTHIFVYTIYITYGFPKKLAIEKWLLSILVETTPFSDQLTTADWDLHHVALGHLRSLPREHLLGGSPHRENRVIVQLFDCRELTLRFVW